MIQYNWKSFYGRSRVMTKAQSEDQYIKGSLTDEWPVTARPLPNTSLSRIQTMAEKHDVTCWSNTRLTCIPRFTPCSKRILEMLIYSCGYHKMYHASLKLRPERPRYAVIDP